MKALRLFLGFNGRIGRLTFWLSSLAVWVVQAIIIVALEIAFGGLDDADTANEREDLIEFLVGLAMLYPFAAIAVKRLHDRGYAGWTLLLLGVPFVALWIVRYFGWMDFDQRPYPFTTWIVLMPVAIIFLAFLIELGFRRGVARTA